MGEPAAVISEIFSSIQGEGLYCGERQIFVRFAGCSLRCAYCDTVSAQDDAESCLVHYGDGTAELPNPLTKDDVMGAVRKLDDPPGLHHSVSLTGGEPLLQSDFLAELLRALKAERMRTCLETNGVLWKELDKVIDTIDSISADIKIESATGEPPRFDDNRRFLATAARKPTWVKVVVAEGTTVSELDEAAQTVASVSPAIPMIIQPVTDRDGGTRVRGEKLLALQKRALEHLACVRVIPQMHKILGVR